MIVRLYWKFSVSVFCHDKQLGEILIVDWYYKDRTTQLNMLFEYDFGRRIATKGVVAEWSKALALGASPKGRGFEPHQYHYFLHGGSSAFWPSILRVAVFWESDEALIQHSGDWIEKLSD